MFVSVLHKYLENKHSQRALRLGTSFHNIHRPPFASDILSSRVRRGGRLIRDYCMISMQPDDKCTPGSDPVRRHKRLKELLKGFKNSPLDSQDARRERRHTASTLYLNCCLQPSGLNTQKASISLMSFCAPKSSNIYGEANMQK